MKYIYSTSQMLKLSLTLHTFSITGSVAGLFLTQTKSQKDEIFKNKRQYLSKSWTVDFYFSFDFDFDLFSIWRN